MYNRALGLVSTVNLVMAYNVVVGSSVLGLSTVGRLHGRKIPLVRTVRRTNQQELHPVVVASLAAVFTVIPLLFSFSVNSRLRGPLSVTVVKTVFVNALIDLFVVPLVC